MMCLLAAALAWIAPAASAAQPAQVKRGTLEVRVKVTGTVLADDVFRIKSAIEGRVESVLTSTFSWRKPDETLAFLAHRELAAILDAKGAQSQNILEDRWQRVYRPAPVRCPDTCFILKSYLKLKSWAKPQAVLFEAARTLRMVARVRPEDAHWIKDGQELVFWAVKDPKTRLRGRVSGFVLDIQGENVSPGGSFTLTMSPDRYFDPGTDWEGEIVPLVKKDVLIVPTGALIRHGGATYLPVRVSTGVTTRDLTQLTGGVEAKRDFLLLDDAQLAGAERHRQEVDAEALSRRVREQQRAAAGADAEPEPGSELGPAPVRKPGRHADVLDKTDYGEDPYAEP